MKKILSIILIIAMLVLPFSLLLNVKATTQTTNGIQYDDTVTDGSGYKVTGQSSSGVVVTNIGANNTLSMYKILDVYYNPTSNQLSYGFTSSFGTFAQAQSPALTVNDYLTESTTNSHASDSNPDFYDNSDFNELVSKYAMYVRANNVSATYAMTTSASNGAYSATHTNTEAGIYLILPTSVTAQNYSLDGFESRGLIEYGVMIANVVPTASNNTWSFSQVEINAKKAEQGVAVYLIEDEAENLLSAMSGNSTMGTSLDYMAGENYSYIAALDPSDMPDNAHESITDLDSDDTLMMLDINYPSSMTPDLSEIYIYGGNDNLLETKIENDVLYINFGSAGNPDYTAFADVAETSNTVSFEFLNGYGPVLFNLTINPSNLSNSAAGNTITVTTYVVKDPYADVGSNLTRADIRAAFDSNDANYSSAKSVAIRKGVEKVEKTVTLYVTGVTVNNTNSSNTNLSGGEFAVYSTYSNGSYSDQLGSNIVMTNGTGMLNGLDPAETYYLKQVKAPTGYRLYDDKIIVLKGTNDSTSYDSNTYTVITASNGMYTANVVNSPMLALPFTGGSGTVVYTGIGLFIVLGAAIFMVLYKKKNKKEVTEEL